MTILTETKYLDECTFSSGSIKDEDCVDIADWSTDGDTGTGVSSAVFFDSKSCFKMDVVSAGGGNLASRAVDIGSFQTNPNVISLKLYHSVLGTLAAGDYFEIVLNATSYRLSIRWASDGLFIYDGTTWNEVGTNLVSTGAWQEWTFSWTQQASGVVDVYLDNVLQASGVDCSDSTAGTTGTTTFRQYGTSVIGLTYIDWMKFGNGFRIAGETWLIQEGGKLTIRTDTRWHKNSVASMLGSISTQTVTEGELVFDGTDVRWLAITGGSGDSPIGTTVTQGGVSGYYLGFWSSLTATPATAIGATGFIKFREVTGGAFSAGALTFGSGTGAATAAGADVTGWIEIVADAAAVITVPRLGKHTIVGSWFYLADTDATLGQVIQIPTNGGGTGTECPGLWIETAEGSNTYEYWPALSATAGWARQHMGAALGETDVRQNFVKAIGSGRVQIGEASSINGTYAQVASQTTSYATLAHSCTYAVVSNVCTITYTTGHLLKTGAQVGVDFTSGGASALDGTFTITVIDPYIYTFALTTGNTSGAATVRPGVTMTMTAHTLGVGDVIYSTKTTGTLPDGAYTIYAVTSANAYLIAYPHTAALTSGSTAIQSRYVITYTAHALAVGNRVYLDFTSGSGVDGIYTIIEVPDANTFRVIANNSGAADSGNVSIKQTIGNIPPDNCKIRIPNVILRECPTATRSNNQVTAATGSRPNWVTTTAGAIDIEYAYSTWYHNYAQAYSLRLYHSATFESLICSECATALDIDDMNTSMYGSQDIRAFSCVSNFAGGTVKNCKFQRGNAPGTTDHAIEVNYCNNIVFTNVTGGIIQFARSTGKAFYAAYDNGCSFINCRGFQSDFPLTASLNITITNYDHCDRYIGYTNATTAYYAFLVGAGCSNIVVDGVTFGFNGVVPNVHPYNGIFSVTANTNGTFKNAGTKTTPLACGSWRQNLYSLGVPLATGGNNNTIKYQRIYIDDNCRTGVFSTVNSDKNITFESVHCGRYVMSAMAVSAQIDAGLNSIIKGGKAGNTTTTGQSSCYGTHFRDIFLSDTTGRFILACNESTAETTSYFTMVSGTAKFNSVGGILMGVVGNQAVWEDSVFRKGHIGFLNTTPTMSGGTASNYTLEYDINIGSGYSDSWTTLSGANLSGITIDPNIGFKMKIRITTLTANTTAITYLRIDTVTSTSAQTTGLYPVTVPVTSTVTVKDLNTAGNIENARVLLLADDGGPMPSEETVTIVNSSTTATVTHTGHGMETGDKVLIKGGSLFLNQGVFTITYISDNSYSYTMSSAPGSSPTGTITATYVVVSGLTNSSGVISAERYFSSDQPVTGWIRKSTSTPIYQQGNIIGTVDSLTGFSIIVQLVSDE